VPDDPLETLREGHAAFNRGDPSWSALRCTEDVEWGTLGAFPGMEDVYRGREGVVEWMDTVRAEWEEFEVSVPEVLGGSDDALAVVERIWGRGRESGAEGEMTLFTVYRFTPEGRIAARKVYPTSKEALAALEAV
jgi:ketosteroid isomerase-like protein